MFRARSVAGLALKLSGTLISRCILNLDISAHQLERFTCAKVDLLKCFGRGEGQAQIQDTQLGTFKVLSPIDFCIYTQKRKQKPVPIPLTPAKPVCSKGICSKH